MKVAKPLYSPSKKADGFLFTSGQLPVDKETNIIPMEIENQTKVSLENIGLILKENGYKLKDILKVNIYLKNINDLSIVNEIYQLYFEELALFPARTAVAVNNLPNDALIEIECIAYNKSG